MDDETTPDDRPRGRRHDEDRDGDPRPRRTRGDDFDGTELLLPGGSAYAIVSLYAGLIGLCLPFVGLVFAVPAFVCGLVAVSRWKKANTYGGVTSNLRAVIGLVLSGLGILIWGFFVIMIIIRGK